MNARRAVLALALACAAEPPAPYPRILSVSPSGGVVEPDRVLVEVVFSEPVDPEGLLDGRRLALCRAADLAAVERAAGTPAGIGPELPVVAGAIALADGGRRATLAPLGPLAPREAHAVVVGTVRALSGRPVLTPEGRRRTWVVAFETGERPDRDPPAARWVLPPHGPAPANLRALRLDFGEPVTGAPALAAPGVEARAAREGPAVAGLDLASPLPPGPLGLSVEAVRDLAGNPALAPPPLEISACHDVAPPLVEEAAPLAAGETWVEAAARASEMASLAVEVGLADGRACGALPDPPATVESRGAVEPCPGFDPCRAAVACPLALRVERLCPGRRLRVRLAAEDLAGHRSGPGPWRETWTRRGVPRPVLTEVLADAAAPEAGGEYVEIANLGTAGADLSGHFLAKRTPSGAVVRCALDPVGGPIAPGAIALAVGGAYDGRYGAPGDAAALLCGAAALLGGIANDRPPEVWVEDPGGRVLSSIGAAGAPRCSGRSVERVHPAGPDAPANLACARAAPGTPAACNGWTPAEECPAPPF